MAGVEVREKVYRKRRLKKEARKEADGREERPRGALNMLAGA